VDGRKEAPSIGVSATRSIAVKVHEISEAMNAGNTNHVIAKATWSRSHHIVDLDLAVDTPAGGKPVEAVAPR
jgi:hypothetical protein